MTGLRKRIAGQGLIAYLRSRIAWGAVLLGILKWLTVILVVLIAVGYWFDTGSDPLKRTTALIVFLLFAVSLAYLFFVSSFVWTHVPGLDKEDLEPTEGKAEDGKTPVRTVQVVRLGTKAPCISIVNDSPLPALRVDAAVSLVRESEDAEAETKLVRGAPFSVPAHNKRYVMVSSVLDHVGIFRLRSTGVRVWDLIGLLARTRGMRGELRVRVVPNMYRLTYGIPKSRKTTQTSLGIPDAKADALDYDRVREYRPGDPLKTIHWKIVAHSQGELYTKLFETATITGATLVIDPYGPDTRTNSLDAVYTLHDVMLEGGFSLIEHARENGIPGTLCFVTRAGSLVETNWEGPATLGWFVEMAKRPAATGRAREQSVTAIQAIRHEGTGYAIFATSHLTDESVAELIACHHGGGSLVVVHALPASSGSERTRQAALGDKLRNASIPVIGLESGYQIVRELS